MIYLVTFHTDDLNRRDGIIERIKGRGAWARITPTTWCIKSNSTTASALRNDLSDVLNDADRLFVVDISTSKWGSFCLPKEVTDWLNK